MSISEVPFLLAPAYERAISKHATDRDATRGIRRAFRRALYAASNGDVRPAILLTYRYP